jgi:hypothetical protein
MSLIDSALAAAFAAIDTTNGVTVTIRRGDEEAEVTATPAESAAMVDQSDGARTRTKRIDYLILASAYDFGDGPVDPEAGDELDDGDLTFECAAPNEGVQPWEFSDRRRSRLRIHYREI